MDEETYTVRVTLTVTASDEQEAIRYALADLTDKSLGPWTYELSTDGGEEWEPEIFEHD